MLPAYAGMIRGKTGEGRMEAGAPRVCGDDPAGKAVKDYWEACSPRMRG